VASVTVLEGKDQLLPGILDGDMAKNVEAYLDEMNISRRTGTMVSGVLAETRDGASRFSGVTAGDEEIRGTWGSWPRVSPRILILQNAPASNAEKTASW